MSGQALLVFLPLAALGAYVQTLTGFAFGLIVMGGVGLTGALSLPHAAVAVSLLVLVNAAQVLAKGWREVRRRELALILLGSLPTLVLGYAMLEILAATRLDWLRAALGTVIVVSALQLLKKSARRAERSPDASFLAFGTVAGLMGGLFSTSGPPLVYHLYRQPFAQAAIRETLVTVFAVNSLVRLSAVGANGALSAEVLLAGAAAAPGVVAATFAARRWPPPLSAGSMRAVVFVLLLLSGLALAVPSLLRLIGAA